MILWLLFFDWWDLFIFHVIGYFAVFAAILVFYWPKEERCIDWIEVHDTPYTPLAWTNFMQDFLHKVIWPLDWAACKGKILPTYIECFKVHGFQIVELCGGGGGPLPMIIADLEKDFDCKASAVITDIAPNVAAWKIHKKNNPRIDYVPQSVDATKVPKHLKGVRVVHTAIHHFNEELVQGMIQDTIDNDQGILFLDLVPNCKPIWWGIIALWWGTYVNLIVHFFRYPPWVHLMVFSGVGQVFQLHDAIISLLRCYSNRQFMDIVKKCKGYEKYQWDWVETDPWASFSGRKK